MAQNVFINVTVDAQATKKTDHVDHRHEAFRGASAAGDFTISFDKAKVTSMTIATSCIKAALASLSGGGEVTK